MELGAYMQIWPAVMCMIFVTMISIIVKETRAALQPNVINEEVQHLYVE
jgi:hypothetical protein